MKKHITLVDLAQDMVELIQTLVAGNTESLALRYADDSIPDAPTALEIAAFRTPPEATKYPTPENREFIAEKAAAQFLQICSASSAEGTMSVGLKFLQAQIAAGPIKTFFPNDAGNGIQLVYEKYTFVFIVTPGNLYEYSPWPSIV